MLPRMALNQIEHVVKVYKTLAQTPSLAGAKILKENGSGIAVVSAWTQRNLERKTNQQFIQSHILNANLSLASKGFPIDVTTELLTASTEDEKRRAVLRQATIDGSTKQFIEIWDRQRLIKNYDLSALDVHGDVYTDSEFSAFEWSPDQNKVLYIAEKKLPKSEPFYKQKPLDKKEKEKKEDDEVSVGNEHIYKPHWGEVLVGKHRPVVVVLDTTADTISALSGIPDELSPAQVLWTKDSKGIVGVAWKHEPRYLGLIACTNRDSWIFLLQNGEYRKLSSDGCAVRSPRFSPNKKYLIWLERQAGGAHHNAHRLMCLDFESDKSQPEPVVNIVETDITTKNNSQFYGLYGRLPTRCWSNDSRYIFLTTPQKYSLRSYIIDTNTKDITEIQSGNKSLSILDVKNDIVAFSETCIMEPSALSIGKFEPSIMNDGNFARNNITTPTNLPGFENFMFETIDYIYDDNDEVKHFNFIYFGPKSGCDKSVPLIVTPHGGPHSNYVNTFQLDYALLPLLGMSIIQVNYRGSTGMGEKNVEYLMGKVGDVDVKDCVTATKEALKKYPWLDPKRIGVSGGSHGGFLAAHLSAQHPDIYTVAAARNPVIDIAAMFTISDIPDCRNALTKEEKIAYQHDVCAAETSYPFDETKPIPEAERVEMLVKMFKCSPIIHVDKVKAPTLICIGRNDLRVPPSQGKLWYQRLKANNVKTKMLVYDDSHSLSSGTAEIDNLINVCLWLLQHTSNTEEEQ